MHLAQPLGLLALAALPVIVILYSLRPARRQGEHPGEDWKSEC